MALKGLRRKKTRKKTLRIPVSVLPYYMKTTRLNATIDKAAQDIAAASCVLGGELVSQGIAAAAEIAKQEVEFKTVEARARSVVSRLEDARLRSSEEKDKHLKKIIEAEVHYYNGELDKLAGQVTPDRALEMQAEEI